MPVSAADFALNARGFVSSSSMFERRKQFVEALQREAGPAYLVSF
jgi:hypothetical protein